MQTLFDIRKRTEHASYEKHVDDASKAPGANKHANHAAKTALGFKICNSESDPSHHKQDGKKTNPDTLTDDKNTPDTPQANLYRQRHAPMRTEYPHRINARRSKKIAYLSTVKIVSQKA